MEPVRNSKNHLVVEAARLHRARDRRSTGTTLIEGPHLLEEAVKGGAEIIRIFASEADEQTRLVADDVGVEPLLVDPPALKRLAGTETPRGPVAVVTIPESVQPGEQSLLVSWGVSDPGNVGTMIRIARAFGWAFGYTEGTADPWSPKVLRSGAGNQFATSLVPISGIAAVEAWGYVPVATAVAGGESPTELGTGRWAVLIGEEAAGLPDEVIAACDRTVTIPMPGGAESLNAAVAAGIVAYVFSMHKDAAS